ncbi:hypothetical protein CFOL_v3_26651 [Cephalotus follicularis]|uniref:Uncharacterized protein n=1 Tax=Cephalotus follicularis TaxID=3775 RepID=A0A1Q3CSR3_CEPFO|nr:hypothetical protein CFOL_v3_26651 [Cephalotus follicularis]
MKCILFLAIVTVLFLFHSRPTLAHEDGVIPRSRVLSHPLQEGRQLVDGDSSLFASRKLGVHIRKVRVIPRAGGARTTSSSTAIRAPMSSLHVGSVLGCHLVLFFFFI